MNLTGNHGSKRQANLCRFPIIMLVFTARRELHEIIRSHQKIFYALLMEAATPFAYEAGFRQSFYVGGKIGMLSVPSYLDAGIGLPSPYPTASSRQGPFHDKRYWIEARRRIILCRYALCRTYSGPLLLPWRAGNFLIRYSPSRHGTPLGDLLQALRPFNKKRPFLISPVMFANRHLPTARNPFCRAGQGHIPLQRIQGVSVEDHDA